MTGRLDQLAGWEQDIRDELATVSTDLEILISRRDHLQAKLDLVRVLQNLERGAESEDTPDKAPAHTRQPRLSASAKLSPPFSTKAASQCT